MISIALALLLSQTGTCKTGSVCQSSRYEANTPYGYLSDGGVPRQSDGGVIYPQPALKVRTQQTAMTAVGVNFNQLPPCPGIAVSSMQWVIDRSCYYMCTTGGWISACGGGGFADGGFTGALAPLFASGSNVGCTTATTGTAGCLSATTQNISGVKQFKDGIGADFGTNGGYGPDVTYGINYSYCTRGHGFGAACFEHDITSASYDHTDTAESLVRNGTPVYSITGAGDVLAGGANDSVAAFTDQNGASGHLFGQCNPSVALGCYVAFQANIVNGSRHGWLQAGNKNYGDGGLGFQLVNPGSNGGTPGASTDYVFDVDYVGNMSQADRGMNFYDAGGGGGPHPFILCPDPSPLINERGVGAVNGALSWADNTHQWYQCETKDLPDGGNSGWQPVASYNATGNGLATSTNGLAGGQMYYYQPVESSNGQRCVGWVTTHPIVSGTQMQVSATIESAGTVGGTFRVLVRDSTSATTLATVTGISCTDAAGTFSSNATTLAAGAAKGDTLSLCVDTSTGGCSGTEPAVHAAATW